MNPRNRRTGLLFLVVRFSSRVLAVVLVCLLRISPGQAQPVGPEFRVNTYTTNIQKVPRIAIDSGGNFVVVWMSFTQDGSRTGIFGQRYNSAATPLGGEFQVNTYTTSYQMYPSVASDSSGNFVVVWQSDLHNGLNYGVVGQRYASTGAPLGTEFLVTTYPTSNTLPIPSVACASDGNFVVVWDSYDGSSYGVFGQRYNSAGAPLAGEFRVSTYTTNRQSGPSVASVSGGNFVVVWQSDTQDGSFYGVFGQLYGSTGAPLGSEFRVNTYTTYNQRRPSVVGDSGGNFVVVWISAQDGSAFGVFGQRYSSTGAPLGPEFRVNTYTTNNQAGPSVANDSSGNFVVVWESYTQDGSLFGVFGQRYGSAGAPLGTEFRVNTYTTYSQEGSPSVASDLGGNFVVVWQSATQDGSLDGVFGQRFCSGLPTVTPPSALTVTQTLCQ